MIPDEIVHESRPCPHCIGDTCMLPEAMNEHLRKFHGQGPRESREVCIDLYR